MLFRSTPDGITGPIAFPVYTGERGISTGIQYPSGYPSESRTIETSAYSIRLRLLIRLSRLLQTHSPTLLRLPLGKLLPNPPLWVP